MIRPSTILQSRHTVSGFTLIELLVVISIIALLVALLLPALGSARVAARQIACASNVKQMGIAVQMYASDSKDSLPWTEIALGTGSEGRTKQIRRAWWMVALAPYYGANPNDYSADGTQANAVDLHVPGFLCPETKDYQDTLGHPMAWWIPNGGRSYSMNTLIALGTPYMGQTHQRRTLSSLQASPSSVMFFGESASYGVDKWDAFTVSSTIPLWHSEGYQRRGHPGGVINFGFLDGHVEALKFGHREDIMMGDDEVLGWGPGRNTVPTAW